MSGDPSTTHINETMNSSVAESTPLVSAEELQRAIPDTDTLMYIRNDAYIGDISSVLGVVYFELKSDNSFKKSIISVNAEVDPASKLNAPQTISEFVIDSKIAANINVLSFLSAQLNVDELFEVRIVNNAAAHLQTKGERWNKAILDWLANPLCQKLIDDPNVGTVSVVVGAVQKYLTVKKFKKFEAKGKGGAFGVNVGGSLYTSTSQFDLKIVFGLDLVTFVGATSVAEFEENLAGGNVVKNPVDLEEVGKKLDKLVAESTGEEIVRPETLQIR